MIELKRAEETMRLALIKRKQLYNEITPVMKQQIIKAVEYSRDRGNVSCVYQLGQYDGLEDVGKQFIFRQYVAQDLIDLGYKIVYPDGDFGTQVVIEWKC